MTDLIDRQAAIDAIKRYESAYSYDLNNGLILAMNAVADVPTINPVKHGRWVQVTNGRGGHECNMCHSYAPSFASGMENLSCYCPHCGARME